MQNWQHYKDINVKVYKLVFMWAKIEIVDGVIWRRQPAQLLAHQSDQNPTKPIQLQQVR